MLAGGGNDALEEKLRTHGAVITVLASVEGRSRLHLSVLARKIVGNKVEELIEEAHGICDAKSSKDFGWLL